MQLWIWRNFRIRMPGDWEMLQFSRDVRVGRCAFADRYQFRLELNWRVVAGPPDFDRMMSDYRARLLELGMQQVHPSDHGPWRGIGGEGTEGLTTRFGRYFPGESCLAELVFLWGDSRDRELEGAVLDSMAEEPPHASGARRWCAFGMDMLASQDTALRRCAVEPAHVEMVFADAAGQREERFARRGMVREWLRGTVRDWQRSRLPAEVSACSVDRRQVGGHGVDAICGETRSRGLPGLCGRKTRYEGEAWLCPGDGRLYAVSRTRGTRDDGAGGRLACCAQMAESGMS